MKLTVIVIISAFSSELHYSDQEAPNLVRVEKAVMQTSLLPVKWYEYGDVHAQEFRVFLVGLRTSGILNLFSRGPICGIMKNFFFSLHLWGACWESWSQHLLWKKGSKLVISLFKKKKCSFSCCWTVKIGTDDETKLTLLLLHYCIILQ